MYLLMERNCIRAAGRGYPSFRLYIMNLEIVLLPLESNLSSITAVLIL